VSRITRDYRCNDCDAVSEHWASAEEIATLECPGCGGSALVAMIGAPMLGFTNSVANGEASSDGMTSSIDRWDRARAQKLKTEKRNLERHGTVD
jgi:putative FmdB family regulatory protein